MTLPEAVTPALVQRFPRECTRVRVLTAENIINSSLNTPRYVQLTQCVLSSWSLSKLQVHRYALAEGDTVSTSRNLAQRLAEWRSSRERVHPRVPFQLLQTLAQWKLEFQWPQRPTSIVLRDKLSRERVAQSTV